MCTQILQYLHLHRLSITMHSQLLLWKCRDVHGYGAAGSPLSAPSISTGCGLTFLPHLPLYVDSLVSLSPRGNEEPVWL